MSESNRCGGSRTLRIGELARRSGASHRMLRYYEQQGLLPALRRPSGYREYPESSVRTVRQIRALIAAGLPTSTIASVLPCVREEGERLVPTCANLVAELREERRRLDRAIHDLVTSRDLLDVVIAAGEQD